MVSLAQTIGEGERTAFAISQVVPRFAILIPQPLETNSAQSELIATIWVEHPKTWVRLPLLRSDRPRIINLDNGADANHVGGCRKPKPTTRWTRRMSKCIRIATAILVSFATVAVIEATARVGPAHADTGTYELDCPSLGVTLPNVSTSGTITASDLGPGSEFFVSDYQTQIPLSKSVVKLFKQLGAKSMTVVDELDVTGATPETVTESASLDLPEHVPDDGVILDDPYRPIEIGPFTASGGEVTVGEGSETLYDLYRSAGELVATVEGECTMPLFYDTFGNVAGVEIVDEPASGMSTTTSDDVSAPSVVIGEDGEITVTATVYGNSTPEAPTGSVDFDVCGPTTDDELCPDTYEPEGKSTLTPQEQGDSASATSNPFYPTTPGVYCFSAEYVPTQGSDFPPSSDNNSGSVDPNACVTATPPPFSFTSASGATATVGQRLKFAITTYGSPPAVLGIIGQLPPGIRLIRGSGRATLFGRPSPGTAGTYSLVLCATFRTEPSPHFALQAFRLTVNAM